MSPCESLTSPVSAADEESFIRVYKEAFEGKPYFESYSPAEAAEVLHSHLSGGVVAISREDGQMAGFGCAVPLRNAPEDVQGYMREQADNHNLPADLTPDNAWYMADMGILEVFRGRRLAYQLVGHRLAAARDKGGQYYFMRTAAEESNSRHLYLEIGAQQLAAEQDVSESEQVTANQSQSTRRIFLHGECGFALNLISKKLSI